LFQRALSGARRQSEKIRKSLLSYMLKKVMHIGDTHYRVSASLFMAVREVAEDKISAIKVVPCIFSTLDFSFENQGCFF